jgi:hypothetical protein
MGPLLRLNGLQKLYHPEKMPVEGREAHPGHVRQILDADGFGKMLAGPPNGPAVLRHAAAGKAELAHHRALPAVDDGRGLLKLTASSADWRGSGPF